MVALPLPTIRGSPHPLLQPLLSPTLLGSPLAPEPGKLSSGLANILGFTSKLCYPVGMQNLPPTAAAFLN